MAKKTYLDVVTRFSSDISAMSGDIAKIQDKFNKVNLGDGLNKNLQSTLQKLEKELNNFQQRTNAGIRDKSDLTNLEKSFQKINGYYKTLSSEIDKLDDKKLAKLMPKSVLERIEKAKSALEELTKAQRKVSDAQAEFNKKADKTATAKGKVKTAKENSKNLGGFDLGSLKKVNEQLARIKADREKLYEELKNIPKDDVNIKRSSVVDDDGYQRILKTSKDKGAVKKQEQLDTYQKQEKELERLAKAYKELEDARKAEMAASSGNVAATNEQTAAFEKLKNAMAEATGDSMYKDMEHNTDSVEKLETAIKGLNDEAFEKFKSKLPIDDLKNLGITMDNVEREVDDTGKSFSEMYDRVAELDNIKRTVAQFFSLANAAHLLRRAVNSAFNAVKELDAAMTETAVVTDMSVGDMWEQLPRYTKTANELGVTTLGAYETMTLFYQQGLDTNEAFELGTETMKMARIAGLDYAEATDKMTAALRGFNMELNQASAQRIADVYSELAAITAADTEEISSAMTKTASIANSANMEFETTSAFLSQIIETTRESAETAGTAMKTVIARFQELKKSPSEIGEIDGEIVDANKIETALRTVGVALRDANGQFRDLDDVFLELASKWDGLDTNTQRYIATIAAGSRQQSRFIAMMSNYGRTMELVNAAYASNGASQKQYEKTLESLESKLARLKNAWDEFVLGITNSELIKTGVDLLTKFLQGVNKLTTGFGGLSTTILRLGAGFGSLKVGKPLLNALMQSLNPKSGKALGADFGTTFIDGMKTEFSGNGLKKIKKALESYTGLLKFDTSLFDSQIDAFELLKGYDGDDGVIDFKGNIQNIQNLRENYQGLTERRLAYNAAIKQGIPADQAAKLLTEQDTKATYSAIMASKGLTQAEIDQQLAEQGGVLVKLQATLASKINTWAKEKETLSTGKATLANWAYTHSATAAKIAMLGMAAAAVLVVAGIVKLVKWAKNNTLEKRMDRAGENTKKISEAAQDAKEAYYSLNETLEKLKDGEDILDTMVQGTDAWTEKVAELNNEITKLIDLYPELKGHVYFDAQTGLLQITEEGQKIAKQLAQQNVQDTQFAYVHHTQYQYGLEEEYARNQIRVQYDNGKTGNKRQTGFRSLKSNEAQLLYEAFSQNSGIFTALQNGEELANRLVQMGISIEELDQSLLEQIASSDSTRDSILDLMKQMSINSNSVKALTKSYNDTILKQQSGYTGSKYQAYYDDLAIGMTKGDTSSKSNYFAQAAVKYEEELVKVGQLSIDELEKTIQERYEDIYKDVIVEWNEATQSFLLNYKDDSNQEQTETFKKQEIVELLATEQTLSNLDYAYFDGLFKERLDKIITLLIGAGVEEPAASAAASQLVQTELAAGSTSSALVDLSILTEAALKALKGSDLGYSDEVIDNAIEARRNQAATKTLNSIEQRHTTTDEYAQDVLTSTEVSAKVLDKYTEDISENIASITNDTQELDRAAKNIAADIIKEEKGLLKINDLLAENENILAEGVGVDYYQTLADIAKELGAILGQEVSIEFLQNADNLDLVTQAAQGSAEAWHQLKREMALTSFEALREDAAYAEEAFNTVFAALQTLDGYSPTATALLNTDPFVTNLIDLLNTTSIVGDDIVKIMDGLGWEPIYETIELPGSIDLNGEYEPILKEVIKGFTPVKNSDSTSFNRISNYQSSRSSGGSEPDPYENSYDKLYNTMEDLNELTRDRNKLEREYTTLLNKNNTSAADLVENLQKQVENLEAQAALQQYIADFREQQIRDTLASNSDLSQYATYNFKDMTIEINWDAINSVTDADLGQRIEDYIGELEELQDQMDEANDELAEIQNEIIEFAKQFEEQYMDFEERVLNAIVQQYQNEIDELSAINDSINSANEELLSSINDTLSKQRQERDNEKTENELGEMQRRLDYLRQDTSGANALEIKQLEKQLAEAQEDYTDTLIDQKISELEEQNEQAAEQRERQILFAEAQLEAQQKTGELWDKVYALMDNGIDENGIIVDSSLWNILADNDEFIGKSFFGQQNWAGTLADQVDDVIQFLKVFNSTEQALARGELTEGSEITFKTADNKEITGKVDEKGNVMVDGKTYTDVYRGFDGGWVTNESYENLGTSQPTTPSEPTPPVQEPKEVKVGSRINAAGATIYTDSYGSGGDTQYYGSNPEYIVVAENRGYVAAAHVSQPADIYHAAGWFKKGDVTAYKTGGLADFTGPAWLDGTKARPELVLNQRDTQNFIQLKDVLADVMKRGLGSSENNEEVLFDIDINIEKVESQEDIDNLLNELERRITSHARYRNVNALTLKR